MQSITLCPFCTWYFEKDSNRYLPAQAVRKAGVGIEGDAHKILRDFGVRMEGVYNLAVEAGYRMKLAGAHSLEGMLPSPSSFCQEST